MKKVGILTFHSAHNYGAVLQAFALKEFIKSLDHRVELINYRPERFDRINAWFHLSRFKKSRISELYREVSLVRSRYARYCAFDRFIESKLDISPLVKRNEINSYDTIFYGSDQIWNPRVSSNYTEIYWGVDSDAKNVSYAASMGASFPEEDSLVIKSKLGNFDALSVRESDLQEALSKHLDKEVNLVLDPTLIVPKAVWESILATPEINEPYVLLYQVRNSSFAVEVAEKIAKKLGVKVIFLSASIDGINSEEVLGASPEKFLGLFKHAEYVVSTSFHGTVFSMIFNKPFLSVYLNDGKDGRVKSLLEIAGISSRGVSSYDESLLSDEINWEEVESKLKPYIAESRGFVVENI